MLASPSESESATPTASASMLVAIAMGSMVLKENDADASSFSLEKDSRIMFTPMSASRMNATQWLYFVISSANCEPM